ncbi:MAG TPA: 3'-5' exonuclease, partial [Pseudonocardia sp.]|nr:3'-5' exonuclease [Pseudonocardia sp.]
TRNWRSDPALLRALNTVFGGTALGDPRITVHPIDAAHRGRRLRGGPAEAPVRLRVVGRGALPRSARDTTVVGPTRELVAQDLAADVATMLAGPATFRDRSVRPGDIAVLVRTNDQGTLIRDALDAAAVPAVLSGTVSVFTTPVAAEWLTLLEACAQPRLARLRAAALTCFVGHSVAQLCGPRGTELLDELGGTVREWASTLAERGVAALLEAITTGTALPRRLLARTDGERTLTDLRHVAQALHAAATTGHLGPTALTDWLRHRIDEAALDVGLERSRRLESDAAVQIITIHRSKGLEFPIIYLPFGWDRNVRDPDVPLLHDEFGRRVLDVGGETGEGWKERCARHRAEEAGEDLRLLYVALTRAQCQVVAWWAPATTAATSPVHRLLLGRAPGTSRAAFEPAERYRVPADTAALSALRAWAGPEIAIEPVGPPDTATTTVTSGHGAVGPLRAAAFTRGLDLGWRRTSYSALTAGAGHHGRGVSSEPENPGTDDETEVAVSAEPAEGPPGPGPAATGAWPPSPLAGFPLGAGFGTLVHAVFEVADLTAADLPAELSVHCTEQLGRGPVPGVDPDELAAALLPVAHTALGPLAGGRRLADVAPTDRLAELEFELPLAGGDRVDADGAGRITADATIGDLVPLLRRHLPADDPLRDYPPALAEPGLGGQPLRGYLTGSIDAVLRLPGPRFVIVDYKTNWLGPIGPAGIEPLTAAHYAPQRLARAMIEANYPLQALLYGVALHRYLRWRLPGYDPAEHLGGVLYLFVRGMCGPTTPVVGGVPCGVFSWAPPPALTVELSQLLDRGAT